MKNTWEWVGMIGRKVETNEGKGTVVAYVDGMFVIDLTEGGTVKRDLNDIKVCWTVEALYDLV